MAPTLRRSAARSSLVSHLGIQHGDRSFLLVRERPGTQSAGECLALHGAFDQAVHERLHTALLTLAQSPLPLVVDLRGISALDEGFLMRLLKVQRELTSRRTVTFHLSDDGPVLSLIQRLGLEERFGLEATKRLPLKRNAVPALTPTYPVSRPETDKTIQRDYVAS